MRGVCGVPIVRVLCSLAMASFSISPVDVLMVAIFVTVCMAVFVRSWPWRMERVASIVGCVVRREVTRCVMASGAERSALSMLAVIFRVLLNL